MPTETPSTTHPLAVDKDGVFPFLCDNKTVYDRESILRDIDGSIHTSVPGFLAKFFGDKSGLPAAQQIALSTPPHDNLIGCLKGMESAEGLAQFLGDTLRLSLGLEQRNMGWYPVKTPDDFHQQCHSITLFNTHKTARPSPEVVGVFHLTGSSDMNYREGLLLLCGHARALFYQRPDRLFVHGFYVFGHSMECWMFDRSGIYSSQPVNLNKDTTHLWTIMAAYSLMVDKEWGHSNLLKEDEIGVHVVMENNEKIYLETPGFYSRETTKIVGGPLLCHRGKTHSAGPWTCVAKYKWGPMQLKTEKALLKKVQERNVWGVVRSLDFKTVGSTEDLRGGLIFGLPHQLNDIPAQSPSWSTPVKLPGNDEAISGQRNDETRIPKHNFQLFNRHTFGSATH